MGNYFCCRRRVTTQLRTLTPPETREKDIDKVIDELYAEIQFKSTLPRPSARPS